MINCLLSYKGNIFRRHFLIEIVFISWKFKKGVFNNVNLSRNNAEESDIKLIAAR